MSKILNRSTTTLMAAAAFIAVASATTGAVAASLVTSADIRNNTIKSADIHDGTIGTADLDASVDKHVYGHDRIAGWHEIVLATHVLAGKSLRATAPCYGASVVVGGGYRAPVGVEVVSSKPTGPGRAWAIRFVNTTGVNQSVEVWAACALTEPRQ